MFGPISKPVAETLLAQSEEMDWVESDTPGFPYKPLYADPAAGQKTWLMKIEAGAFSPMHAHEEFEHIFVLEGAFSDQDRTYGPGDYAVRAPGVMHEAKSDAGALMLLFYCR